MMSVFTCCFWNVTGNHQINSLTPRSEAWLLLRCPEYWRLVQVVKPSCPTFFTGWIEMGGGEGVGLQSDSARPQESTSVNATKMHWGWTSGDLIGQTTSGTKIKADASNSVLLCCTLQHSSCGRRLLPLEEEEKKEKKKKQKLDKVIRSQPDVSADTYWYQV